MVEEVALTFTDIRIGKGLMDFKRARGHPFAVLIVAAVLGDFSDIDFRIEICGESFAMVASVAVDYIEILHVGEVVFGGVSREHS